MSNFKYDQFHKAVLKRFEKNVTADDIIREYKLTSKATEQYPARSTIYNWFGQFQKGKQVKMAQIGSLSDKKDPVSVDGIGQPAPKIGVEHSPEPKIDDGQTGQQGNGTVPQGQTGDDQTGQNGTGEHKGELAESLGEIGDMLPDLFKQALSSRAIDVTTVPQYETWRGIQERSSKKMIMKYLPIYNEWATEIDFFVSYFGVATYAGLNKRFELRKKVKDAAQKADEKEKPPVMSSEVTAAQKADPAPKKQDYTMQVGEQFYSVQT